MMMIFNNDMASQSKSLCGGLSVRLRAQLRAELKSYDDDDDAAASKKT